MVRSSGIILSLKIGTILFNYVFLLLLSNTFGAAYVGYFTIAFTLIQLFAIVSRSGLEIAFFKEIASPKWGLEVLNSLRLKSVIYIFSFSILLFTLIYYVNEFYPKLFFENSNTAKYAVLFMIGLPFSALMYFNSEIHRAKKRFVSFVVYQNFGIYLILCVFLFIRLLFWEWAFDDLVWIFLFSLIFLSLVSFINTSLTENASDSKEILFFKTLWYRSIPIGLSTFCFFLMSWFDGVVLAQFHSEEIVGKYAIAYRVALFASFALVSINSAIGPKISELFAQGKKEELIREAQKSTQLGILITLPVIILSMIFPKLILGMFGVEFEEASSALIIILVGQFTNTLLGPTGVVLQLTGFQKDFKNIVLVTAIISIALNYLIIPKYGLIGAAIVNSVSLIIWKVWSSIMVKKHFGLNLLSFPRNFK